MENKDIKKTESDLFAEYVVWLKKTHNIAPDDTCNGLNMILELTSIREEYLGERGETELVKMLKDEGMFYERKKEMESSNLMILTFEEFKNAKLSGGIF
jgi:hypothetical protein